MDITGNNMLIDINNNNTGQTLSHAFMTKKTTALRLRMRNNKDLANGTLNDKFLLKYLRARDYDIDESYKLIKGYFQMRKSNPEMFRTTSDVRELVNASVCRVLPHRGPAGETIFIVRAGQWNLSKWSAADTLAATITELELAALDEETQKNGVIEVMDIRGFTMFHFLRLNPFVVKLGTDITDRCLPLKFKRIHVINGNRFMQLAWTLVKPLLGESIKSRIVFHGSDLTKLYDDIPRDLLPSTVGGTWEQPPCIIDAKKSQYLDDKLKTYWNNNMI